MHIITVCADSGCGDASVQLGVGRIWPGQSLTTGFCGDIPHNSVLEVVFERVIVCKFFVTATHAEQAAASTATVA